MNWFGLSGACWAALAVIRDDPVWAVAAGLFVIASAIVDATERRKKDGRK